MRFSQGVPPRAATHAAIGKFASADYSRVAGIWEALVQSLRIALVGLAAITLAGFPANACPGQKLLKVRSYIPSDLAGETIRKVNRGDKLAIACDGVDLSSSDVRVVLNVDATGAKKLGYQGVLATDQTRSDGKLQIRVPDAPNLANHTVAVRVYVMNGDNATSCDAGLVRVV